MRGRCVSAWSVIVRVSWRPRDVEKRRPVLRVAVAVAVVEAAAAVPVEDVVA